jgi:hypothetical protein
LRDADRVCSSRLVSLSKRIVFETSITFRGREILQKSQETEYCPRRY